MRQVELPYSSIGRFYREKFGERIQKLPVSIATDCPNRLGLKGMKTCVFCDEWGSSAYPEKQAKDLKIQLEETMALRGARYGAVSYLAYFQAYTSTFLAVKKQRDSFETALNFPNVRGLIIGTRPDCLSPAIFQLWNEYSARTFVSIELGVQSFEDHHLEFMRRGHSGKQSIEAIELIKAKCPNVNLGIHLIFGNPGETLNEIIETAKTCNRLGIKHVKLHNLHVLKGTPLEEAYAKGEFVPDDLETYTEKVILFLRHLSAEIVVHRLAAVSSRWDELIAPEWTRYKMKISQHIIDQMNLKKISQGQNLINRP
jgi:uncharacterized protein